MKAIRRRSGSARVARLLVACATCLGVCDAWADGPSHFYKGKTIQIVVGFGPGGGYDLYARLVARRLSKHLPGHPPVVVTNMSGAGSRTAANWLYNSAPRDGATLGVLVQTTALDQAMRASGVHFDAAKFNWIGNPIVDNEIMIGWRPAGYDSMDDVLTKKGLVCGATGPSTPTAILPLVVNHLTPANIKIIPGYPGGASIEIAMERGEVSCFGGDSWTSASAAMSAAMNQRKLSVLVQFGIKADPRIAAYEGHDVPLAASFAKTALDRNVLDLIDSQFVMGRPLLAPPGVPPERVAALRKAFDETMNDPELLADAKKAHMAIAPASGEQLQALAANIGAAPPNVLARAAKVTDPSGIK